VRLILDEDERLLGPGDVVVQRGTNHAWACASDTPAVIVAVLLDKAFADERPA
jgi:quercetin dioxygenase-like cupin family protein